MTVRTMYIPKRIKSGALNVESNEIAPAESKRISKVMLKINISTFKLNSGSEITNPRIKKNELERNAIPLIFLSIGEDDISKDQSQRKI